MNRIFNRAGLAETSPFPDRYNVRNLNKPDARVLITDRLLNWREEVLCRLNYLCSLPLGWDGYRAGPVHFNVASFALRLLESVCGPDTPAPSIVPGPSGDLQIEWHLQTGDIELHVRAPNDVHCWRQTPRTGEDGQELELTIDFTEVGQWLKTLMEPACAPIEAAA